MPMKPKQRCWRRVAIQACAILLISHSAVAQTFKTNSSGNWTNPATWLELADQDWKPATSYPGATGDESSASIQAHHALYVNTDATVAIKNLYIEAAGKLTILAGGSIAVSQALTIDGHHEAALVVDAGFRQCGDDIAFVYNGRLLTYGTIAKTYQGDEKDAYTLCWMDRNLGAAPLPFTPDQDATGSTDHKLYGDLFQWGREPDGHQLIMWENATTGTPVNTSTTTLSASDTPGHAYFITTTNTPFDWRNPQHNDLWQGTEGINNPCPAGWRLPTRQELEDEMNSWQPANAAGAFENVLKWPTAGIRSNGSHGPPEDAGSNGNIWSAETANTYASYLLFNENSSLITSFGSRATGMSVRCTRE